MKTTWLLLIVLFVVLVSSCSTMVVERTSWASGVDATVSVDLENEQNPVTSSYRFSFGRNQTYRFQKKDGTKGRLLFGYGGLSIGLPNMKARSENGATTSFFSLESIRMEILVGPGYYFDFGESKLTLGWGNVLSMAFSGESRLGIACMVSFHPSTSGKYPVGISAYCGLDLLVFNIVPSIDSRLRGGVFVTYGFQENEDKAD